MSAADHGPGPGDRGTAPAEASIVVALLRGRTLPCPVCRAPISDVAEPRCPACAAPLEVRVGSADLHPRWWISALLASAVSLGFHGVCTLILLWIVASGISRRSTPFLLTVVVFTLLSAAALAAVVRGRHRFRRMAVPRQRVLGLLAWLLPATGLVASFLVLVLAR